MKHLEFESDDSLRAWVQTSWERLPDHLEQTLLGIGLSVDHHPSRLYDRLELLLNLVLTIWGLGTLYLFRDILSPWLTSVSSKLPSVFSDITQIMVNPVVIPFVLVGVSLGIWLLVFEKNGEVQLNR